MVIMTTWEWKPRLSFFTSLGSQDSVGGSWAGLHRKGQELATLINISGEGPGRGPGWLMQGQRSSPGKQGREKEHSGREGTVQAGQRGAAEGDPGSPEKLLREAGAQELPRLGSLNLGAHTCILGGL